MLRVPEWLVRKLIAKGVLRARRRYKDWRVWRDRYRLELRTSSILRAAKRPEVAALLKRHRPGEERE
jgi:hypothetical protein